MRHFLNTLTFFCIAFGICSCTSNKKLIGKSRTEFGRIKYYAVNSSNDKSSAIKLYADVDSNGIRRYYSFYPKGIVMTDERAKNLSYTVLFKQLPDHFDSNAYHGFSELDTLVFYKAETLLENPDYSHLKSPKGATGYEIEVYYLHGFPKNKRFVPL
jgi:hypothetical protein